MISCPNVLLIGAAGRNVGKTELACEVIRRHAPARQVVGVKVTVIRERGGVCPRGGEGCGVCTSLEEPFSITRESSIDGVKDTSRMLRAGAREVLWLRVRHEHLGEGMRALIERIPAGALVVCESNSAREAIAPGLFLVVRRAGAQEIKPSCEA
ncbi:MAG: hypothetical protein RBU30_26970, partial [Polyangia bacterium]|nr:hypothetical protein [Polyangia bacterium]